MAIINEQGRKFISQIQLPGIEGARYVKDIGARQMIAEMTGVVFHRVNVVTAATVDSETVYTSSDTPIGVTWTILAADYSTYGITGETATSVVVTGTLAPSAAQKSYVYLVPSKHIMTSGNQAKDIYDEYVAVEIGTDSWMWEKIGDTDLNIDTLGNLAYKDSVVLSKGSGSTVLGKNTTFTNSTSGVTFTGTTDADFVNGVTPLKEKLVTTSIKGVGTDITFTTIDSVTSGDPTKTVFGTDTAASYVTAVQKTATNTVFGTNRTASLAIPDQSTVSLAKPGSSKDISYISYTGASDPKTVITSFNYDESNELLTFIVRDVSQSSVIGIQDTAYTYLPYDFSAVTVPNLSSNTTVNFDAISDISSVVVPVVTSNTTVETSKVTTKSTTAATSASNSTIVATGKVSDSDSNGDAVVTDISASTAKAITALGSGTAAAQTITVGTNNEVKTVVYDDLSVSTTDHSA